MKIRVWAEYFTVEDALKKEVRELLKKYNVNLCIATCWKSLDEKWAKFLKTYEDENIETTLWLLLPDESGYWPSERNVEEFADYVENVFEFSSKYNIKIPWIAVDLETPIYQVNQVLEKKGLNKIFSLLKIYRENKNRKRFVQATYKYSELLEKIHRNNTKTIVAAIPWIMEDKSEKYPKIQDILETPVTSVNWDVISLMIYNSMLVGYSRGFINFQDARYLLYLYAKEAKEKFKERASISLGVTYTGKLGNEPYYETPSSMEPDVQIVKSAGIEDIGIYNLEGILKSEKPEEWFEMVINAQAKIPAETFKIKFLRKFLKFLFRII